MAYKVKRGHETVVYIGLDPVTEVGNIKISLGDMTKEQIEAWHRLNPVTSLAHLEFIIEPKVQKTVNAEK